MYATAPAGTRHAFPVSWTPTTVRLSPASRYDRGLDARLLTDEADAPAPAQLSPGLTPEGGGGGQQIDGIAQQTLEARDYASAPDSLRVYFTSNIRPPIGLRHPHSSRSGVILAAPGTVRRAPKGWGEKLCL
jgi:hypothetical protein